MPSALLLFTFGLAVAACRSLDGAADSAVTNATRGCEREGPEAEEAFVPTPLKAPLFVYSGLAIRHFQLLY